MVLNGGRPEAKRRCRVRDHVTVEQPVAGALRSPRQLHGPAGRYRFRDSGPVFVWGISRLPQAGADAAHGKVEPVQVHRVTDLREVHDAPVRRPANLLVEPFGVRPRPTVDSEHPTSPCVHDLVHEQLAVVPLRHDENAIGRNGSTWIDDERAAELALDGAASVQRGVGGGRPIVIRTWNTGRKPYFARLPGLHCENSVFGGRSRHEAMNGQSLRQRVSDVDDDFGAFRNAQQRPWRHERSPFFAKRGHVQCRSLVPLGTPIPARGIDPDGERTIRQDSRRPTIVVALDGFSRRLRSRCGCRGHCEPSNRGGDGDSRKRHRGPPSFLG